MPDLETLVCGGAAADGKVSCETLIASATTSPPLPPPASDPGLPADSFTIPIGDDVDWTDINAIYDRDDSTKGNTNPKSQHSGGGASGQLKQSRSGSQRFSGVLAPKAPIIGLPNKIQHSGYLGSSRRLPRVRIFPKNRPAATPEAEPASPKVSCVGKVLSQRDRSRRRRSEEKRRCSAGCWAGFAGLFRRRRGSKESLESVTPAIAPARRAAVEEIAPAAAVGLGGMTRFASRRRSASWGSDVEGELVGHVAGSTEV